VNKRGLIGSTGVFVNLGPGGNGETNSNSKDKPDTMGYITNSLGVVTDCDSCPSCPSISCELHHTYKIKCVGPCVDSARNSEMTLNAMSTT
jgi:hypothetical protein